MNDKLWVLVLIAGNIFCVRSKNPQQPSMLHNGNPANSDDKYVVYTERLRRAIREFGLTDAKLNLRRESRDDVSLENCGLATTDKCNGVLPPDGSRPSRLFEQVKRIESAIDCQWFCADYYSQNCTWFLYDETSKYCKLFTGPREELYDDCYELGFSSTPSLSECISTVSPSDANSCYWFRQGYCRFDNDLLDNLEHSKNMTTCQQACQFNPSCNFFTFSKDEEVCILHQVELEDRKCDLIHGPPLPSLQSCLNQMQIPWANSSALATAMATTPSGG